MAVEHFIPEDPKPLPEHRRLQAKVQCAAQKQGEGGRETSAQGPGALGQISSAQSCVEFLTSTQSKPELQVGSFTSK